MGQSVASDPESLNAALTAFNHVSVSLKIISEHLAYVLRESVRLELEFDRDGKFKAAYYPYSGEREQASYDFVLEIRSQCEWLPKHVQSLWEAWQEADTAIAHLPLRLVERLDALTKTPWVAAVRRNCLDNVLKWPGERGHQTSLGAVKVFGTVPDLLKKAKASDPFATWDEYQQLLATYTHDLYAIRDAIAPAQVPVATVQVNESSGANTAKLFPKGVPGNSNIVDLVARLDAAKGSGRNAIDVAREFFGESYRNDSKSRSHLSQIRRMKRNGRITL